MSRVVRGLVLTVSFLLVGFVPSAPAHAAEDGASGLGVRLVADRPIVTIDKDAPADQPLAFEVIVTNGGDDVVPGVVVRAQLPGGAVERQVGDVAPGGEWREIVESTVPATNPGGPLDAVAVARASDGREAQSLPARVDVQVISSAVIDRDDPSATPGASPTTAAPTPTSTPTSTPASTVTTSRATSTTAPATQVLGATYERPLDGTLPRTGTPIGALALAGAALVASGGLLVRRTADRL